jgi:chromatin segregation and condensation protein Rec8/ScpA/Scc1 (kleisin family)
VRKESEEYQLLEEQRREERERIELLAREHMIGTAHEDHLEEDVMSVWKKIQKYPKKTMMLSELCGEKNREEFIKTLMSILFLAYDNKIIVYQQKFPYGNIFIKSIGYA